MDLVFQKETNPNDPALSLASFLSEYVNNQQLSDAPDAKVTKMRSQKLARTRPSPCWNEGETFQQEEQRATQMALVRGYCLVKGPPCLVASSGGL